jgi:putative transposase
VEEGTVVPLPKPGATLADDPLLAVLREGARRMLMQAVEAEVEAFLAAHADFTDNRGRRRLVVRCRQKVPSGWEPPAWNTRLHRAG